MEKSPLYVRGMHGLGDNIHQRAILRVLLEKHDVTLETSWAALYHDLIAQGLKIVRRPIALRTQLKNATREAARFQGGPRPHHIPGAALQISYSAGEVLACPSNSVMEAMFRKAGIGDRYKDADMRLPIPGAWYDDPLIRMVQTERIRAGGKPLLIYRPLVERPEWNGCRVRNPRHDAFAEILAAIRDDFFVVSIADLEPGREWIVGPRLIADMEFHKGELIFESLAALISRAVLMYSSPGFGPVLAPAVGCPTITILGGYENSRWLGDGAKFAPYLGIDTMDPCSCGTSGCIKPCTKRIMVAPAIKRVREFVSEKCGVLLTPQTRGWNAMFNPSDAPAPHTMSPRRFPHNPNPLIQQLNALQGARQGVKA